MPVKRIDSVYDIPALEAEQAKLDELLERSKQSIIDLNNQRVTVKNADITSFTRATEDLSAAVNNSVQATEDATLTHDQLNKKLIANARATKDLAAAKLNEQKAETEQAKADAIRTKSMIDQEKELDRLIALEEKKQAVQAKSNFDPNSVPFEIKTGSNEAYTTENATVVNDLDRAQAAAANSAATLGNNITITSDKLMSNVKATGASVESSKELAKAKLDLEKATSKENETLQGYKVQTAAANAAAKEQALIAQGMLGPYQLLNKEYIEAQMNAKNLAVEFGIESTEAKAAAASALQLSDKLQAIDRTVGQAQRNVGNYPSALAKVEKGFSSIYRNISKLAYIIPGLGIGGAILLMLEPLKELGQYIGSLFTKIDAGKITIQTLNDVNRQATEIYSKQKAEVQALANISGDLNENLDTRKSSLEKLIALNPDYLRGLTLENITTDEGRAILDKYNDSLEKKAGLQAALAVNASANQAVTNLQAERDALVAMSKQGKVAYDDLSDAQKKFVSASTFGGFRGTASILNLNLSKSDIRKVLEGIDGEIKKEQYKVGSSLEIYKQKFAENLTSGKNSVKGLIESLQASINTLQTIQPTLLTPEAIKANVANIKLLQDQIDKLLGKTTDDKKENKALEELKNSLARAQKYRDDAAAEIEKAENDRLAFLKEGYKREAEDQKSSLAERYAAIDAFNQAGMKLLDSQKKTEEDALAVEVRNDKAAAKSKQEMRAIETLAAAKRATIVQKYASETADFEREVFGEYTKAAEDDYKKIEEAAQKAYAKIKAITDRNFSDQKDAIDIDANNKILEVQKKAQAGGIKNEEDYNNQINHIKAEAATSQDELELKRLKASEALVKSAGFDSLDLQKKIGDLEVKINEEKNKKLLDAEKDLLEEKRKFQEEALKDVQGFVDDSFDAKKNRIQDEIDLNDEQAQRQIDLVNASTASEQDKAAEIIQIQAKQAAQKTALIKQQKEEDIKKAEFDKAMAVISVGIETAKTIALITFKAAAAFPFSAPILAEIPWVLGTSALEIAAILAKPIPKYKTGRENGGDEIAWVGDGGVSEIIKRENGVLEKTPNKDTLTFLGAGDKVYKDEKTFIKEVLKTNPKLLSSDDPMEVMRDLTMGALSAVNFEMVERKDDRRELSNMTERIEKAVGNIRINTQVVTKDGWRTHNKRLRDYDSWVDRYIKN